MGTRLPGVGGPVFEAGGWGPLTYTCRIDTKFVTAQRVVFGITPYACRIGRTDAAEARGAYHPP